MSSLLKRYKENVKNNKLEFEPLMYKNIYGSFGIAYYRCFSLTHSKEENDALKEQLKEVWNRMRKNKVFLPFIDDKDFIEKMMKVYGIEDFPYGNIAIVVGNNNSLFAPCFINESTNLPQIIPLREDGVVSHTLLYGKVRVITKDTPSEVSNQEEKQE